MTRGEPEAAVALQAGAVLAVGEGEVLAVGHAHLGGGASLDGDGYVCGVNTFI